MTSIAFRVRPFAGCLLAAALSLAALPSHAFDYPPLIEDQPVGYGFAQPAVLDVLGIHPGQTRDEALAAMRAAVPGFEVETREVEVILGDGRGNEAGFGYIASDTIGRLNLIGTSTRLDVSYAPATSGGRVTSLTRISTFAENEQASLPEFLAAMEAKYGPPTHRRETNYGLPVIDLYYGWYEGRPMALSDDQKSRVGLIGPPPGPPETCFGMMNPQGYVWEQERRDRYPACTAVMTLKITLGRRDDLISRLDITMVDHRRWFDSSLLADRYIVEELDRVISGGSGAAAPQL